jgi:SnoaL-like protein
MPQRFLCAAYALVVLSVASSGAARLAGADQRGVDDAAVRRVVADYIGLYRAETLDRWKALFLPGFTATVVSADGSVTTRTLDEFFESQRTAFARGPVSERLENVTLERSGHLARVFADFYFTSGGNTRHGQLILVMVEEKGQFRIASLAFTYHLP